jgi:ketopantoate reductase
MRRPIAIVGLGQLGGTFGQGLLRLGRPVLPVLRGDPIDPLCALDPELVLVAVAEKDLDAVLAAIPEALRGRVGLLQNELLPPDWEKHGIVDPTVAVVWFEKKRGRPASVVRTTRIGGPHAELLVGALESIDLPARRVDARDVVLELVRKNLYILTTNVAGLFVGGTTGDLVVRHRALALEILDDLLAIEAARLGGAALPLDRERFVELAFLDFAEDPNHSNAGRTARDRLRRALARADAAGLPAPALRRIAAQCM